jgi:putative oxidoreductase
MFTQLYTTWLRIVDQASHVFLLLIRLYWGYGFMQAGWGKFMNWERTVGFFTTLNIPMPGINAGMAAGTELLGGLCLLLGFKVRLTTVPLISTMIVAYATAHIEELKNIFTDPDAFLAAPPFLFLWACLVVLFFGAGKFSFDRGKC